MSAERRFGPDETARILQRAVELQPATPGRLGPGDAGGLTLAQLTAAAEEAGIPPESIRLAVAEIDAQAALRVSRFYGSPTRIVEERQIPRSVPADEYDGFVDVVREAMGMVGVATLSSRSAIWASLPPGAAAVQGRQLTVSLRSGPEGSVLRLEEDLQPEIAGYFGLGGGLSVAGGLVAFGALGSITPLLSLLGPVIPLVAWGTARTMLRRTWRARRSELAELASRLAARAEAPFR